MLDLSKYITPTTILSILGGLALLFVIVTWILIYHWSKYNITKKKGGRIKAIYFFVSAFLWIIIILSAFQVISKN